MGREPVGPGPAEIVHEMRGAGRSLEGMALIRVLLALLADHVFESVVASRQTYLAEFGRYLDRRGYGR